VTLLTVTLTVAILALALLSTADVPQMINYQGQLTDSAGESVGEVYLYDNVIENSSGRVSIGLKNEFPLYAFTIPLEFTDSSTFPVLDSVVWIGRLASPEILEHRIINLLADGNPPDTLLLVAIYMSDTAVLAPGDGEVALLFFTSDSTGIAFCDTTFYPPVTSLSFVDSNSVLYTPEFLSIPLVCLDIEERPSEATILFPQDSTAFCGDSAGIWGGYFPSWGDTLPDGGFRQPDSASFWYSYDNMNYYCVGTDYSGHELSYPWCDSLGDGWSVTMNANSFTEGWGWLRMLMYVDDTTVLGDTVPVYFFPDAPEVTILSPDFEEGLGPTTAVFQVAVTPARYNQKEAVRTEAVYDYEKGVPKINQHGVNPTWDEFYCGPTSVYSSLLYWAITYVQHGSDAMMPIVRDRNGRPMTQNQCIEELAQRMNIPGRGRNSKREMIIATNEYLLARGLRWEFVFREIGGLMDKRPPKFKDLKRELEKKKEDVIGTLWRWDVANNRWMAHAVTFNSLRNKADTDGTHNVDFMDPEIGDYVQTTLQDRPDTLCGFVPYRGFNWQLGNLFVISPKNPIMKDRQDSTILFQQYTDDTLFTLEMDISDQAYDSVYFFTFRVVDTVSGIELEFEDYITYYRTTCCNHDGIRGNADGIIGVGGPIDVADLTYLVAYLFKNGPAPPCLEEGNVDGIVGVGGPIDVADLTYLVAYLFKSGPAPPPC